MKKYNALPLIALLACVALAAYAKIDKVDLKYGVTSKDTVTDEQVYLDVDKIPAFPGGDRGFSKFLGDNIKYPKRAKRSNVTGKVYIQFVVEKDGSLSGFKAMRDPGSGLAEEGIRALSLSPKWSPGIKDGKPVRTLFTVPINFSLAN